MGESSECFLWPYRRRKTRRLRWGTASGLTLVAPEKRNPLLASSFGTAS
ncbi:hypothetical protein ACNKHR_04690 [Shigella flexneri]